MLVTRASRSLREFGSVVEASASSIAGFFVEISSARQKTATHEGLRSRHVSSDPRRASAQRVSNDDPEDRILVNRASAYPEKDAPVQNGALIPIGVRITPDAAPGSTFAPLNPGLVSDPSFTVGQAVTIAASPDGKTLLIPTSGYNSQNFTSGPNAGDVNPAESNKQKKRSMLRRLHLAASFLATA
jgi:hypothetical protein